MDFPLQRLETCFQYLADRVRMSLLPDHSLEVGHSSVHQFLVVVGNHQVNTL